MSMGLLGLLVAVYVLAFALILLGIERLGMGITSHTYTAKNPEPKNPEPHLCKNAHSGKLISGDRVVRDDDSNCSVRTRLSTHKKTDTDTLLLEALLS
ncbi:MAG: hypothetical protein ABSF09_00675 [Candidatus Bathyarchaeia archaeon]